MGEHAVARDAAGGVGGAVESRGEQPLKDLFAHYAWAGPIILTAVGLLGAVIGFLLSFA